MQPLAHAILIEGGNAETRMEKAMELLLIRFSDDPAAEAKLKAGIFEDLIIINREDGKEITVKIIEQNLVPFFKQKPFASTGRACIIQDGECLNATAQNKLLKLLEEPAKGNVIMILTENAERLFQTVRSRCMRLWIGYPPAENPQQSDDIKELASMLIYGKKSLAEADAILSRYEKGREEATDFLRAFQIFLRSLSVGKYSPELIGGEVEYSKRLSEAAGKVEPKHAVLMRESVLLAEKAQNDIERGYRVSNTLRGMALQIRRYADNQGGRLCKQ